MANPHPVARKAGDYFGKVRIARELLKERAAEILEEYLDVVQKAKDAGDYETAAKSLQWLIDHMPADEEGNRIVEQSADKKQDVQQKAVGPSIQIAFAMGGLDKTQKQLPKPIDPIIEVETIE